MAKTLKNAEVTTKAARERLKVQAEPHWRRLDKEVHLGYRKQGKHYGEWLVRWRVYPGYKRLVLGAADDVVSEGCLSFDAAEREARKRVEEARREAKAAAEGVIPTVGSVVRDYINERDEREAERRGRKVRSDASHRLSRYVIGQDARGKQPAIAPAKLASVTLPALTDDDLLKWREGLPATLSASSKQRLINDLRAALNAAYERHRKSLDAVLPTTIRYGLKKKKGGSRKGAKAVVRENQILTDAQVVQVLRIAQEVDAEEGWEGDLYRMAVVLAATGARLAQAKRMRVCDYQRDKGRLMVPRSYKGNGEKDDDIPVPVGEDALAALLPAVTGRPKDATLLERWRKKQAPGEIRWVRDGRGAWQTASEFDRPWREIRKRAKLAASIVPYSLRHTSIVRGLRANLPVELVAKLHDTSSEMIRTNYARFIAHGLEELAARAIVPLLPKDDGKVVALR